jgi:hypothetical protein
VVDHVEELILYPRIIISAEVIVGLEAPLTKRRNIMSIRSQTIGQRDTYLRRSNEYTLSSDNMYPLLTF